MSASSFAPQFQNPEFLAKLKNLVQTSQFVYRDSSLSAKELELYRVGTFFREPTLFDCTSRLGGVVGETRFVVISSSPRDLSGVSEKPSWGLAVLGSRQLFKVVDVESLLGKTQVTLAHVPAGFEDFFHSPDAALFDKWTLPQARADFKEALESQVIAEHLDDQWLQRVERPPGMDAQRRLIPE